MTTKQVSKLCGVTLRELQWWDEQGIVTPAIDGHKRIYTDAEVETVRRIQRLRKAGIGLRHVKKCLKLKYSSVMRISVPTVIMGTLVVPE